MIPCRNAVVQGKGGIFYAGAWCGYGFHEDGLRAGVAVAELLEAKVPWTPQATSPKISLLDRLCISLFDRFARLALKQGFLRLILPNGQELAYGDPDSIRPPASGDSILWKGESMQFTYALAELIRNKIK